MIFVHRSDRASHNTGKKYAYDLRAGREDFHDSWQWDDTAPSAELAYKPLIKVAPKYVVDFRCIGPKCTVTPKTKKTTGVVSVLVDNPTKKMILEASGKLAQCLKCKDDTNWEAVIGEGGKTRQARSGETGIIL